MIEQKGVGVKRLETTAVWLIIEITNGFKVVIRIG